MINTEIKIDEVAMEIKLNRQLDYVNAPELDKAARRKAHNRKENNGYDGKYEEVYGRSGKGSEAV